MNAIEELKRQVSAVLKSEWEYDIVENEILVNDTRAEFEGDYTVVVFPFTKALKKAPPQIAEELGSLLLAQSDEIEAYNVVKGFLNISFAKQVWIDKLKEINAAADFGNSPANGKKVLVEFSSPNTNKPLHLGHIRNILLGWSSSMILETAGYEVVKTQIVNDRGIAICKSMLAYQLFGEGTNPVDSGIKGDHLIGKFYVGFETHFKKEYADWQVTEVGSEVFNTDGKENEEKADFFARYKNKYFNEYSSLGAQAKALLLKWEAGDSEVIALWKKMNSWVYAGFEETYQKLGVDFDCYYYESETYKLGKELIENGLKDNSFYKKADGSVWIDLEDVGMDHKLVLRSDGTSVYITQDLGTAKIRNKDHNVDSMVYVVADEQDYHFKALFEILKKLGEPYADSLYHLNYGMVDLPTGKMKSREGTVVDADDLIAEVISEAKNASKERGEIEGVDATGQDEIYRKVGLAALKYFIIKVNPRKRMTFDPKESVDMQGQTGPYIQNAYVRIKSILRKSEGDLVKQCSYTDLQGIEKDLILSMSQFPDLIQVAAKDLDPSSVANYCYSLAKTYHRFYHDLRILSAETEDAKLFRLQLSNAVANVLAKGMKLLGIEMPERM